MAETASDIVDLCNDCIGTFEDCDGDGVPDECEGDCDADGVIDDCEDDVNNNGCRTIAIVRETSTGTEWSTSRTSSS